MRSRLVRRVSAMTATPMITHSAPFPKGCPSVTGASATQRISAMTRSMPTATPSAMKRCRQVRTTIIRPMLAYSRKPDFGATTTSWT